MSKKTLTKPVPNRHPTSDDIDTFVRGGAEVDTDKQLSVNTELQIAVKTRVRTLNGRPATDATSALQDCLHRRGHEDER